VCDTISNDEHFLVWLFGDTATARRLNRWFAVGDGAFTLLAEGFFLVGFYLSYRAANQSSNQEHRPASQLYGPHDGPGYSAQSSRRSSDS